MEIQLNTGVLFFGALISLSIFSALILFFQSQNRLSNRLLALLILTIGLWLIDSFFFVSGIFSQNPDMYFKPIYYSFGFGPLIYFYVRSLTESNFQFKPRYLIHFIPVILQFLLYLFLCFQNYEYRRWYWLEVHEPYTYRIEFDGTFISLAIYALLSIILIIKYQNWLKNNYSEVSKIILNWLKVILGIMLLLSVQWFVEVVLRDVYNNYYQYNYTTVILGILTLVLAFGAIKQINLKELQYTLEPEIEVKEGVDSEILKSIDEKMLSDKVYLNPDLNIDQLAQICGLTKRTVSEHINKGHNLNFYDYVNAYRVKEFQNRLKDSQSEHLTLLAIAFESGFNSKASFNRIFKNLTGKTPSEYKKSLKSSPETS